MKKLFLSLSFSALFLSVSVLTAAEENAGNSARVCDFLSKLKVTSFYVNEFPLYNIDEYSKNSVGADLGFEYRLFPDFAKNFDLGIYGRSAFHHFVPCNIQLVGLDCYSFSEGITGEWKFSQDISVLSSLGLGFLISKVNFVSVENGKLNDVYYDFMLESDLKVRKVFLKSEKFNLLVDGGCHVAFYNEESKSFMTLGPSFGLVFDFNPLKNKSVVKK